MLEINRKKSNREGVKKKRKYFDRQDILKSRKIENEQKADRRKLIGRNVLDSRISPQN